MKKRKIVIGILILIVLIVLGSIGYYYFIHENKDSTLTAAENQWIENNKKEIIDVSIVTDIPVFSANGEGVIFDFLTSIEEKTGLTFNKLSYKINGKPGSDYSFAIKDELEKNDVELYHDNYAIITKTANKYTRLEDIDKMTIGTLEKDLEKANRYLKVNRGFSFKTYKNQQSLIKALEKNDIDGIILPKILYLNSIGPTSKFNISYNITEMPNYIVFHLGDNKKLNTIIKKYHQKWNKDFYAESYYTNFSNYYFSKNEIYENEQVAFRSKRYVYGFISNPPYDAITNGKLVGLNSNLLTGFAHLAGIEISYEKYKNIERLTTAFNDNKLDIFMNSSANKKYEISTFETVDVYDSEVYIISNRKNDIIVNSLSSLVKQDVITIKDSQILESLKGYDINIKTYNNVEHLLKNVNEESIIILDRKSYETYANDTFKEYKVDYMYKLDTGYNFLMKDIKENDVFVKYFNFYLSYINEKEVKTDVSIFKKARSNMVLLYVILGVGIIVVIASVLCGKKNHTKKKKLNDMSKEDKIRYIDDLTSLKNRRYLNDTIKVWDDSSIFPQTIIIVDLNNIAYINDNYGHEEGDKTIVEAANILITNQLENSEIIRTDGNEFLIYLVEYDEKQIISYIRKLNKEFKELSHGFGAAIGYSMIVDVIKTIDDAINEATLHMKSNKEEG